MSDNSECNALIYEWWQWKQRLDEAKEKEKQLRKELCDEYIDSKEGTSYIDLGDGYKLKSVKGTDYKIIDDNSVISYVYTKLEEMGVDASKLIKYKAELSVSGWKNIPPEGKELADKIVTSKPKSVVLEMKTPD
jgi:hypothetical protein